jgi:hypothetical protein
MGLAKVLLRNVLSCVLGTPLGWAVARGTRVAQSDMCRDGKAGHKLVVSKGSSQEPRAG